MILIWKQVLKNDGVPFFDAHQNSLHFIYKQLRMLLDEFIVVTKFIKPIYNLTSSNNIYHYDEICYIVKRINLGPFEILLMQLIYETSSACTTAILEINNKKFFLGRWIGQ